VGGSRSAIGGDSWIFRVYGRWYTVRGDEGQKIVAPWRGKYVKSGAETGGSKHGEGMKQRLNG
jgi:hypothetical protein